MILSHQESLGVCTLCETLSEPRSSWYRSRKPRPVVSPAPRSHRCLTDAEELRVLDTLNSERFQDMAPGEVHATLLDEGQYHCSIRTMYRILDDENGSVKERRRGHQRGHYTKPELLATGPNQVWSWDITKLLGPVKWSYFYLYVILDIFSRYVVGWMAASQETAVLAQKLIKETMEKQNIQPGQLTIHADRGSSMKSKPVAFLLSDLGGTKTHSRLHISDDNPYSEAQFKTLKYRPDFPERFGSLEDARAFCQGFFSWYNMEHHHSGVGLMTPHVVHYGLAQDAFKAREKVLLAAYEEHPERFKVDPLVKTIFRDI